MVHIENVVLFIIGLIFFIFGSYGMIDTVYKLNNKTAIVALEHARTVIDTGENTFATYSAIRRVRGQ